GLLWFGWFGFNAGSALAANGLAGTAFINTQIATAAAMLGWLAYEKIRHGAMTGMGAASGAVAGLVGITPACAYISPLGSILLGLICGGLCAWAVGMKYKFGFDDSLDVVGVHAVGGATGALLIGLLSTGHLGSSAAGLFYGGGFGQLGKQALGVGVVGAYSFVMAWLIGKAIDKTIGFRIPEEVEIAGIDQAEHAESAYDYSAVGSVLTKALASVGSGGSAHDEAGDATAAPGTKVEA